MGVLHAGSLVASGVLHVVAVGGVLLGSAVVVSWILHIGAAAVSGALPVMQSQ